MSNESTLEEEDETILRLEHMSDMMISEVCSNPAYAQCLLHIKAYRNYHKEEREEFKERIDVLDDRYSKYTTIIDTIQILIIILSASAAFIQAGNQMFGLTDSTIQFIGLCVSSWTALTLSISKYYKLDEQKEKMNSLRQQCAELMSELGAREDRLNTLCSKEIWAGPPGAPLPPALAAWENERDEMYNNLKTIIQKKQSLVNDFDYLLDSKESKNLIMRAKSRTLKYKKEKLLLTKQYTDYEKDKKQTVKEREAVIGKPKKRRLADMARYQSASQYTAMSTASPGMALKQSGNDNIVMGVRETEIVRPSYQPELLTATQPEVFKPKVGQILFYNNPADLSNSYMVRVAGIHYEDDKIAGYSIVHWHYNELFTRSVLLNDERALFYYPISSFKDVICDIYFEDELVITLPGSERCKIRSYDSKRRTYGVEFIDNDSVETSMTPNEIMPSTLLINVLVKGHDDDSFILHLPKNKNWKVKEMNTETNKKVTFSENQDIEYGINITHEDSEESLYSNESGELKDIEEETKNYRFINTLVSTKK